MAIKSSLCYRVTFMCPVKACHHPPPVILLIQVNLNRTTRKFHRKFHSLRCQGLFSDNFLVYFRPWQHSKHRLPFTLSPSALICGFWYLALDNGHNFFSDHLFMLRIATSSLSKVKPIFISSTSRSMNNLLSSDIVRAVLKYFFMTEVVCFELLNNIQTKINLRD